MKNSHKSDAKKRPCTLRSILELAAAEFALGRGIPDDEFWQQVEQGRAGHPRSLRSIFQQSTEQIRRTGGVPSDEFWRRIEKMRTAQQKARVRGKRTK